MQSFGVSQPEEPVGQTVALTMIWDTKRFMRQRWNEYILNALNLSDILTREMEVMPAFHDPLMDRDANGVIAGLVFRCSK